MADPPASARPTGGRVLEVGIGDGENLRSCRRGGRSIGVDHRPGPARRLPRGGSRRWPAGWPGPRPRPCRSPTTPFDACLCVGGFTYFGDHAAALREMRRVTRPGGPVVVADEVPWLCRLGIGHLIGLPGLDAAWLRLPRARPGVHRDGVRPAGSTSARSSTPRCRGPNGHRIWGGLGYCLVASRERSQCSGGELMATTIGTTRRRPAGVPTSGAASPAAATRREEAGRGARLPGVRHALPDPRRHARGRGRSDREQRGRPGLLRRPALAEVPVLGVVHVRQPRRRAAGPGRRSSGTCPRARTCGCSTWRSATASISPGSRSDWSVVGVDISRGPARELPARTPRGGTWRSCLGEAEDLPVRDGRFDAALSIGAFNYFNDPERALREMVRAVRPGGTIVVSDEVPDLTDRMPFRKLGLPGVDRWIVSQGDAPGRRRSPTWSSGTATSTSRRSPGGSCPTAATRRIWRGVGYVFVGRVPG